MTTTTTADSSTTSTTDIPTTSTADPTTSTTEIQTISTTGSPTTSTTEVLTTTTSDLSTTSATDISTTTAADLTTSTTEIPTTTKTDSTTTSTTEIPATTTADLSTTITTEIPTTIKADSSTTSTTEVATTTTTESSASDSTESAPEMSSSTTTDSSTASITDAVTTLSDASTVSIGGSTSLTNTLATSTDASTTLSDASTVSIGGSTSSSETSATSVDVSTTSSGVSTASIGGSTSSSDASTPSTDASTPSTDASIPSTEASTPSTDASTPSADASTTFSEASTVSVGGSTSLSDSSTTSVDGLTASTDASTKSTDVQSTSTDVPSMSTGVPSTSTDVPATSTDVPSTSTGVPSTSTDVPSTSTGVPSTSTDVPATVAYQWVEPVAWTSKRLYSWGEAEGDTELLSSAESVDKYDRCTSVPLNGNAGAPYFDDKHHKIHICPNGMLSFDLNYLPYYPFKFGTNAWYNNHSLISPFWSTSDEYTMGVRYKGCPEARAKVYYQAHQRNSEMSSSTRAILDRAQLDVSSANASERVDGFEPTWVLVVTWINLVADIDNSRATSQNDILNGNFAGVEKCTANIQASTKLNHFQAVVITDGVYTFIKFNYPEEGINWAYPGVSTWTSAIESSSQHLSGIAAAGFQAPNGNNNVKALNIKGSGTMDMLDIDLAEGNMIDQRVGEWLYRVENSNGVEDAEVKCNKWASKQNLGAVLQYNSRFHCPQNLWQGIWDFGFKYDSHEFNGRFNLYCLQSRFTDRSSGLRQKCCYDLNPDSDSFTALITEYPYHGHVTDVVNIEDEIEGYNQCCVLAKNSCKTFYLMRPINDGWLYEPPVMWPWFGDPHIVTSDGYSYTFNGLGEYLFTRVRDNDTVIQARTERVELEDGSLGQATYFSAACIATAGLPKVQIQINKSPSGPELVDTLQLIINGTEIDISVIEENSNDTQTIDGVDTDITFERTNASLTVLLYSGIALTATPENKMLALSLTMPSSVKGSTIGLTGVFDGNQENDLTYLNGSGHISLNSTEMEIFNWASTFAVSEEDSIMYYTEDNTDWNTYNNNSFVPVFTDNVNSWVWSSEGLKDQAYEACGNNSACLYDVYITGDLEIGKSSKKTEEDSVATNDALSNFAPNIFGENYILITNGEFKYVASFNDSNGDNVTVNTNVASTLVVNGEQVTITGTVANMANFSEFRVIAKDSKGAKSAKTPLAMICSCANNGSCVPLTALQQQSIETNSVVLECICPTGYTGSLCDADLDACSLVASPCYPSVQCVDSPAPADHTGYTCGDCPPGYTGDGKTCTDVDECADDSKCDSICINSPGSYVCACNSGYELNADGFTCDDINECTVLSPCHQICTNSPGSYECSCEANFILSGDNINCAPANPCDASNSCDSTNGLCNVVNGSNVCSCKKGYTLNSDGVTCDETDECALGTDACEQICSNTVGAYNCSCEAGYVLDSNEYDCPDVNECFKGTYECEASHICSNKPGGYDCVCPTGYVEVDGKCSVLDFSSPVTVVSGEAEAVLESNSVSFSFEDMPVDKYTVGQETTLFTLLADSATKVCANTTCTFKSTTSDSSRRRRSTSTTFYKEYFTRLPGYPQYDNNGDLQLAIYASVPGSGLLSPEHLTQTITQVKDDISTSLGYPVVMNIGVSELPSKAVSTTETSTHKYKALSSNAYIYIGVTSGLVVITIVVVVLAVCIRQKKRQKQRISHSPGPIFSEESQLPTGDAESSTATAQPKYRRVHVHGGHRDKGESTITPISYLAWD